MNLKEIKDEARIKMKGFCRACPVCNGVICAGEVPGMGGALTGAAFKNNVTDLAKIKVKLKTIHDGTSPDQSFDFFGHKLETPIISAPITGAKINMGGALSEKEYIDSVILGSIDSKTIAMTGDSADPNLYDEGIDSIKSVKGLGVPIIKPRENSYILKNIKKAEEVGALAVGVDIDGAGLITMALNGAPVGPKTMEDLRELISSTDLPFILKGVMSKEEALMALDLGAKAIVVSNHGGRVLDHAQSSASVLEEISEAVKGKIMILADGGIRTGVDVFKMLALGADGVLIGRPVVIGAFGNYSDGVSTVINQMKNQLLQTMILTGAKSLKDINRSMIEVEF